MMIDCIAILVAGPAVDTLPPVGRDQGWGLFSPNIGALTPPPTLPHQGGGAARWAHQQPATSYPRADASDMRTDKDY